MKHKPGLRLDSGSDVDRDVAESVLAPAFHRFGSWAVRAVTSLVLMAALIFAALTFQRHLIETKPATPRQGTAERARPVDVIVTRIADLQPSITVFGQISAGRSVDLRMLVSGEVMAIAPELIEGGRVKAGEALVTIDVFEYDGALVRARTELSEAELSIVQTRARIELERAARVRAEEQQRIARREVDRLTKLEKTGASSTAALDASRTRLSIAAAVFEERSNQIKVLEAQLDREQASLDRLRWNVRKAERDLQNTVLKAPFDGVVSNVSAEVGRLLNINDPVATLIDMDRLEVRFSLSDAQYGRLLDETGSLAKRPVTVTWKGGNVLLEAEGFIDRVSPVVTSAAGGFDVFARLKRSAATDALRPGAFVSVTTKDRLFRDVVRVPQTAVHPGNRVFAVGEDDRLIEVPVTLAGYDGDDVLVRGEFKNGMRLMSSRLPDAGPGVLVQPRPLQAAGG